MVRVDPVDRCDGQDGHVERVERVEERPHAVGVLRDERLTLDELVDDKGGLARDVLEAWNGHGEERCDCREQRNLRLEGGDDSRAAREPEDPRVVDGEDAEVEAVVDLDEAHAP